MIVVTGATGQLGRLVVEGLLKKISPAEIVAAVREPQKAADFADRGVQVRLADYDRPETLKAAFAGADKVLLISGNTPGQRFAQHQAVIEAAREAGVGQLVYTSVLYADTSKLLLAPEHKATEQAIRESGVPFTFLRNGWYTENYIQTVTQALATGSFIGSAGDGKLGGVPRADLAEAAVEVLSGDGHVGKVYELAGDEPWSYADLAAAITTAAGKPVTYQDLPTEQHQQILVGAGLPEPIAAMLADADRGIAEGELATDTGDLHALIGRPTTPLTEAVAALVAG